MAEKVTIGGASSEPPKRSESAKMAPHKGIGMQRTAPRWLIVVVAVLTAGGLGAYAFYLINGGWATQSQMKEKFQHEEFPISAAKRGMMGPLEAENSRRKAQGEPLLQVPQDRHQTAAQARQQIEKLQREIQAKQGTPGAPNQTSP